ncbi:MAG: hypothetical protein JXQ30_15025 [Spirochaetes bacterium]|nr:hypothetical protein [Spirochaetota bacterium]
MRIAGGYMFAMLLGAMLCNAVPITADSKPADLKPADATTNGVRSVEIVSADIDEERFEKGIPPSFILTGYPTGDPPARMEITESEGYGKRAGALSFMYDRGVNPLPVLYHHVCLEEFTSIEFRIRAEKKTLWVVNVGDLDGAQFSARREIAPGEWTPVAVRPSDFVLNENSPVKKKRLDPKKLGFGYAAFDLFALTEKEGTNRVLIDDVRITRAAVSVIEGDYELSAERARITENTRIKGDLILQRGAGLVVTAERFRVDGDILVNGSSLSLEGGRWIFSQNFRYHHRLRVSDGGTVNLSNGRLDLMLPYGAEALRGGSVLMEDVRVASGLFTFGIQNNGALRLAGCENTGEIIVYRGATVSAQDCKSLLLWLNLERGFDAELSLPDGSRIGRLILPKKLGREIEISNCTGVLWGVIAESGSSLTVRESRLRAVGLHFTKDAFETVSGFENGATYPRLSHRSKNHELFFFDTKVDTWNFYASGRAKLEIRDSVFGESLSFGKSRISIYDSVCDGTGGYLGARDDSVTQFFRGEITCDVLAHDNGSITVADCGGIGGRVEAAGRSRIVIRNTPLGGAVREIGGGTVEIR